jgi:hypothetical protein
MRSDPALEDLLEVLPQLDESVASAVELQCVLLRLHMNTVDVALGGISLALDLTDILAVRLLTDIPYGGFPCVQLELRPGARVTAVGAWSEARTADRTRRPFALAVRPEHLVTLPNARFAERERRFLACLTDSLGSVPSVP